MTAATLLLLVAAVLAVVAIVRAQGDDLAAWGVLFVVASFLIGERLL